MLNRPVPKISKRGILGLIAVVVAGVILLPMDYNPVARASNTQEHSREHSETNTIVPGVRVGDSEQKIKQTFGDDFLLKETEWKDFLICENEGLQFEIHKKNRMVMEFSVTQKNARELGGSFAKPIKSVSQSVR